MVESMVHGAFSQPCEQRSRIGIQDFRFSQETKLIEVHCIPACLYPVVVFWCFVTLSDLILRLWEFDFTGQYPTQRRDEVCIARIRLVTRQTAYDVSLSLPA